MHRIIMVVIVLAAVGIVSAFAASELVPSNQAGAAPSAQQVREQNLDGSGFIRTHEQGTAQVNVTNGSLPVSGTVNVGNFPAPAQGRLIDLGTHNESGLITMPMVNLSDCGHISILAAADGAGSQRVLQTAYASADGMSAPVAITWEADAGNGGTSKAGDTSASLHNIPVTLPFVSVLVDNSPTSPPRNVHAWIWCEP